MKVVNYLLTFQTDSAKNRIRELMNKKNDISMVDI